jgi:biopolymer transport protein ExbD
VNYKSFVDVLFILLLGTIVMLTQVVSVGAIEAELLELGGGGVTPVRGDDIELVVVDDDVIRYGEGAFTDVAELAAALPADAVVLVVAAHGDVRYHRVMEAWSDLAATGLDVRLGAEPGEEP